MSNQFQLMAKRQSFSTFTRVIVNTRIAVSHSTLWFLFQQWEEHLIAQDPLSTVKNLNSSNRVEDFLETARVFDEKGTTAHSIVIHGRTSTNRCVARNTNTDEEMIPKTLKILVNNNLVTKKFLINNCN